MKKIIRTKILNHLAEYKQNSIGISENGTWWKNQQEYRHILPQKFNMKNIIDAGFKSQLLEQISISERHIGFNHLNSSQALALNLFGPFLVASKLASLSLLVGTDYSRCSWKFEHVYNKDEGTNFDLYLEADKQKCFFEVKYTEDRFGAASDDDHHNRKFDLIYRNRLAKITDISKQEFFRDYQLWRNIIYKREGEVIFVIPRFRDDLLKRIEIARTKIDNPQSVKVVFIEDICRLGSSVDDGRFRDHFSEFDKKYLVKNFA